MSRWSVDSANNAHVFAISIVTRLNRITLKTYFNQQQFLSDPAW